jgi:DNA-binding CsgD family transcriptional regulator
LINIGNQPPPFGGIDRARLRIAISLAEGLTNIQIASGLNVTRRTVEFHLISVYRKLGISRHGELARALHLLGAMDWT